MKAPKTLDPDVLTVLEIVQHCGEILSRLPLPALRAHLEQHREDDEHARWYSIAITTAISAVQLEAAAATLAAEEARAPEAKHREPQPPAQLPDDWSSR